MTPEQVVQKYLDISFSMNSIDDRAKLINLTIGPLREQLETVSDENIEEAFVNKRYSFEEYELVERRDRTPRETEITYRLVIKILRVERVAPSKAVLLRPIILFLSSDTKVLGLSEMSSVNKHL